MFKISCQARWRIGLIFIAFLLGGFSAYDQIVFRVGTKFIWNEQLRFHRWLIEGISYDPWQYRVLASYLIEWALELQRSLGLGASFALIAAVLRLLQNIALFLMAAAYWRKLGVGKTLTLLGMAIVALQLTFSGYQSGLALDTYFDIVFQLLAAWLIISGRRLLVLPVIAIATLNRETAGIMALLLAASAFSFEKRSISIDRIGMRIAFAALVIFGLEYLGLRFSYGPRPFMEPMGYSVGMDLLRKNFLDFNTYFFLFGTLGFFPLLGLLFWNSWPSILQRFFWAMVPVWILIHLPFGVLSEARLFLVPHLLIFMPAALIGLQKWESPPEVYSSGARGR